MGKADAGRTTTSAVDAGLWSGNRAYTDAERDAAVSALLLRLQEIQERGGEYADNHFSGRLRFECFQMLRAFKNFVCAHVGEDDPRSLPLDRLIHGLMTIDQGRPDPVFTPSGRDLPPAVHLKIWSDGLKAHIVWVFEQLVHPDGYAVPRENAFKLIASELRCLLAQYPEASRHPALKTFAKRTADDWLTVKNIWTEAQRDPQNEDNTLAQRVSKMRSASQSQAEQILYERDARAFVRAKLLIAYNVSRLE